MLAKHGYERAALIPVLQEIQEEYRYLPQEVLTYIATALDISPASVFGVATFYAQFSLEPKGKYVVRVCDGTACHVKESPGVYEAVRKKVGLSNGRATTPDGLFTVETVSCLGACGLAPVMVVNDQVHGQVTPEAAAIIVDTLLARQGEDEQ
ncbi:MAG: NADH-quinone oxidoreductase subunit NuoE family protein [Chloroflexota bacterium]